MIELHNLTLGYDRHPAVHHLCGRFVQGSLTAIVGPNGAGKSTLIKGLMGTIRPMSGQIIMPDQPRHCVAYLPQANELDLSFPISVYDCVAMGLWRKKGLFGSFHPKDRQNIADAVSAVGLTGFEKRPIGTLSGGQVQRMLFARLMVQDAPLLLLDEPFNAVDSRTVSDLIALIRRWHSEGRTIIAVLHDLDLVKRSFPHCLLLAREVIGWGATPTVLNEANLTRARAMTEAFDEQAPACAEAL